MVTYKPHGPVSGQGTGQRRGLTPDRALKRMLILEQRARGPGTGRHATRYAGRRQGEVPGINRHGRHRLGGRTGDLTGLRAATSFSPTRKTALEVKKEAETGFMSCQRFAAAAGPGAMSILPCPHPVPALPGALSRNQIVLPVVHGADDGAPPERPSARPRRLAAPSPAPFPPNRAGAAHVRRVRAGQRQARRRLPPPSRRPQYPRTPRPARQIPGYCGGCCDHRLGQPRT